MQASIKSRKVGLLLLVLAFLSYSSASKRCYSNSDCRLYAECSLGKCSCKYGSSLYDTNDYLLPCKDHCKYDFHCTLFADCEIHFIDGNRCECRYDDGVSTSYEELTSCSMYSLSSIETIGIIIGSVIGGIIFIATIAIILCFVLKRRRNYAQANTVGICVQPVPIAQQMPLPPNIFQPVYPAQQYQQVAPPYPGYNNAQSASSQFPDNTAKY